MKAYKSIDISNMSQAIYDFPDHIQTAVKIGDNISLNHTYNGIQNIVLAGMGGSAIGGDVARLLAKNELNIPMLVSRNYTLPNWVNKKTLVIDGFCQRSVCVKQEQALWKKNNGYIDFDIRLKNITKKNIRVHLIKSENLEEIKDIIKKKKIYSNFLVLTKDIDTSKYFSEQNECQIMESKYPKWVYSINPKKIKNIILFKCNNFK